MCQRSRLINSEDNHAPLFTGTLGSHSPKDGATPELDRGRAIQSGRHQYRNSVQLAHRPAVRKRGAVLPSNSAIPDEWSSQEKFRIVLETAPFVIVVSSEMNRLLFTPVQPQTGI